jgi:hypothetical protein
MRSVAAWVAAAAAALILSPAVASAGFIPGVAVDGPSGDVQSLGDVRMAPDGNGEITYVKADGGVAHVFSARLVKGAPQKPVRVDAGQLLPSSQPQLATTNGGRAVVVWVNGGQLYASLRTTGSAAFSAPTPVSGDVAGIVSDPSVSMTIVGKAYAVFATQSGDVRAAYMANDGTWTLQDLPLDIDSTRTATDPKVASSSDGTAVAAWTETGVDGVSHVIARRLIAKRAGSVPREVSVPDFQGHAGGSADSPSAGIEADSSYAWVAFRQDFVDDGGGTTSRTLIRRLVASEFDPPVAVDGSAFPAGTGAERPRLAFSPRGRGVVSSDLRSPFGPVARQFKDTAFQPVLSLDPRTSATASYAVPTVVDDLTGTVSWQRDPGAGGARSIVGRHVFAGGAEPAVTLSVRDFGSVDASAGLEASGDKLGNVAVGFAQGDPSSRRVVVAFYDAPPDAAGAFNNTGWRRERRPRFHWSRSNDSWSGGSSISYRLEIDNRTILTTKGTSYRPRKNIADGDHRWRIIAIDGRGQENPGIERYLRIDTRRPQVRISARRSGRLARFTLRTSDGKVGSGVSRVRLNFGDGATAVVKIAANGVGTVEHRFRSGGRHVVRAVAADRAGNKRTASRSV